MCTCVQGYIEVFEHHAHAYANTHASIYIYILIISYTNINAYTYIYIHTHNFFPKGTKELFAAAQQVWLNSDSTKCQAGS